MWSGLNVKILISMNKIHLEQFAFRNPDCPADHHAHRGDPPDSHTAECATASGAKTHFWPTLRPSSNKLTILGTNWPPWQHADHPRPSWPPSPSQRWSEPRWWEGQALRSPSSSKPPQSRLKLLSLLRLTWIAVLKNVNFCTIYTPLNVTNWKNSKLIYLFHIPDWPDNSTSRGPAGKRTLFALCSCLDIFL